MGENLDKSDAYTIEFLHTKTHRIMRYVTRAQKHSSDQAKENLTQNDYGTHSIFL